MPSWRDIVYGLYGAWRLAHLDRGGMTYFDQTVEGFWKSFFAAAIVAPGYIILVVFDATNRQVGAGLMSLLLVHLFAYSLSWTAYPVVVHQICTVIGRQPAFIGYIVAFNWAKVIQMGAYLPVVAITATGVLPGGAATLLNGLVYMLLLGYQWFVTRTALDLGSFAAVGFVVLDLVIGIIINAFVVGMLR
ncbi:MAG: hypothetical protein ACE5GS_05905 [Kiloniellaceae bacterium]